MHSGGLGRGGIGELLKGGDLPCACTSRQASLALGVRLVVGESFLAWQRDRKGVQEGFFSLYLLALEEER
jgi:hypothetical protein